MGIARRAFVAAPMISSRWGSPPARFKSAAAKTADAMRGAFVVILNAPRCEQKLTRLFSGSLDVIVHRLLGLFSQFKTDGPPSLSLAHGRPVCAVGIRRNVLDLESHDIAAAQLAVDCQIKKCQIASTVLDLELGPDCPNVLLL
jgi:hypothetical protein